MLSLADVEYAYRLFLGREAENAEVLRRFADECHSIDELRSKFLLSREFTAKYTQIAGNPAVRIQPRDPLKPRVEVEVSADDLAAIIRRVELTWSTSDGKSRTGRC